MHHNEIIERSNPHAKLFMVGAMATALLTLAIYLTPWLLSARVPFAYLIPVLLICNLIPMISLYRLGTGNMPSLPLITGIFLLVGGTAFDMIVTVVYSPTLNMEANPVARSLLDSGHSVLFVYVYAVMAQVLLTLLGCVMWVAFLRHRATLVASARNSRPKSYFEFVKSMLGGEKLSWRQYLLPIRLSELPKAYHLTWIFAVIWMGSSLYRWYFGMEWLGWFPGLRIQALIAWVIICSLGYALWLWMEYQNNPQNR